MPGSCNKGLRSRPSSGAGNKRSKGLEVSSMNSKKPTATSPMTDSMRAVTSLGKWRLKRATATVQSTSICTHKSKEPSCPPQTPAMRYSKGKAVLDRAAT